MYCLKPSGHSSFLSFKFFCIFYSHFPFLLPPLLPLLPQFPSSSPIVSQFPLLLTPLHSSPSFSPLTSFCHPHILLYPNIFPPPPLSVTNPHFLTSFFPSNLLRARSPLPPGPSLLSIHPFPLFL